MLKHALREVLMSAPNLDLGKRVSVGLIHGSGRTISYLDTDYNTLPAGCSIDERQFVVLQAFPSAGLEALWREYADRVDRPAHYDAPEFFLEPYWEGQHPFAILALSHNRVVGVVTGLHAGERVVCGDSSRPQISIDKNSGALEATDTLVQGLLYAAGRAKLISVYSWSSTPLPAFETRGFLVRKLEGNVVLDLRRGAEALFAEFHDNRKRNIRAAVRNGIEVSEETTAEDFAAYWNVYSAWRNTNRKTIHHNRSFAALEKVHSMRGNHRRFLARWEGKVIAATGVRFFPGGLIEYANNCSLDEFLYLRPNDLLIWTTIQWACKEGFTKYSLGGAHPFLRKSGGTVVPIYRYRLDRTFLHRYDVKESIAAITRTLPMPVKKAIRQVLRKVG